MADSSLTVLSNSQNIITKDRFTGFLDIDRIKQSPLYTCTVSCELPVQSSKNIVPFSFSGIYNSDSPFSIGIQSEYSDQFEQPDFLELANSVTALYSNMRDQSQFILKALRMTEQRWSGSTSPDFSIKIDIPIVRKTDACWTVLQYLVRATSGSLYDYSRETEQKQTTETGLFIYAPNSYHIQYGKDKGASDVPKGTHSIMLGSDPTTWFHMTDAVITDMDFSIGSKKYYDGNPTSVSCNIKFKYWRQPLFEDILNWFPLLKKGYN